MGIGATPAIPFGRLQAGCVGAEPLDGLNRFSRLPSLPVPHQFPTDRARDFERREELGSRHRRRRPGLSRSGQTANSPLTRYASQAGPNRLCRGKLPRLISDGATA